MLGELIVLLKSDLYRYENSISFIAFLKRYFRTPGFNFTVKYRLTKFTKEHKLFYLFFPFCYIIYRRAMVTYGISIPYKTKIGHGLYIGHFGGIVVNSNAIIGRNCNLSQNVTIGKGGRNEKAGCPIIGDSVYIGPGAVIAGKITIGNNVAIGANAVVLNSFSDECVIVGVPAKDISKKGSGDFVDYKWEKVL